MVNKVVRFQGQKNPEPVIASDASLDERVIAAIRTVYDPEISVNLYDLGLIYNMTIDSNNAVAII